MYKNLTLPFDWSTPLYYKNDDEEYLPCFVNHDPKFNKKYHMSTIEDYGFRWDKEKRIHVIFNRDKLDKMHSHDREFYKASWAQYVFLSRLYVKE